jgi:ParB-like chromosome segregation protein Spo0J
MLRSYEGQISLNKAFHWVVRELPLELLREHEETEPARLQEIVRELRELGRPLEPIVVDASSYVILDGHHRFRACRALGWRTIPCYLVDYFSERIKVQARRPDISVTKREVIERALCGQLYPPKTTRHVFRDLPA